MKGRCMNETGYINCKEEIFFFFKKKKTPDMLSVWPVHFRAEAEATRSLVNWV